LPQRSAAGQHKARRRLSAVDNGPAASLSARPYLPHGHDARAAKCPDGGIGRRTVFRWRRWKRRGGSSSELPTPRIRPRSRSTDLCSSPVLPADCNREPAVRR